MAHGASRLGVCVDRDGHDLGPSALGHSARCRKARRAPCAHSAGPCRRLVCMWRLYSFLLNPYAVAACVAKSMSQLRTCLTLLALLGAVHGASFVVACVQALNSVLFVIPLYVAPALVLLGADAHAQYGRWRAGFGHRQSDAWWQWLRRTIVRFVGWLVAWLVLAALCSRDPTLAFIRSVYGSRLLVDDLSPNAGLVWYFFVEMFPHFRAFFIMVVNLHMLSYTVPALLHWRRDPLFATTVLVGIHALFQTYPSVGDTALYLALWSLHYSRLCDCTWTYSPRFAVPHGHHALLFVLNAARTCVPVLVAVHRLGKRQLFLCHQFGACSGSWQPFARQHMGLGARALGNRTRQGASPGGYALRRTGIA